MSLLTQQLLDLAATFFMITSIVWKFIMPYKGISAKELLREVERLTKENEKLQIEIKVWRTHHERLTNDK